MTVENPHTLYFDWGTYQDGKWMDFDQTTRPAMKEMLECFVGPVIGKGSSRTVFACKHDPSLVIKIGHHFSTQNQVEHRTWHMFRESPNIAKWLAPVTAISSSGRIIVQRRTMPVVKPPAKIPDFLSDLKVQNFGMLNGQLVAHDYGLGIFIDTSSKFEMVKPKWWDTETGFYYDSAEKVS